VTFFFIQSAIAGVVGGRADAMLYTVGNAVFGRLRRGGRLVNHDLQRAVRRSYLNATAQVCIACLETMGASPSFFRRAVGISRPGAEVRILDKLRDVLKRQLAELDNPQYTPAGDEAEGETELLLQPKGVEARARIEELRERMCERLLQEVRSWGVEPPPLFGEMVRRGWEDVGDDGAAAHLDWFGLVCAFFVDELKRNDAVQRVFTTQLLADLPGVSMGLDDLRSKWEEWGGTVIASLERIDADLTAMRVEQGERFDALLRFVGDVASGEDRVRGDLARLRNDVHELRNLLLARAALARFRVEDVERNARRVSIYQRYPGDLAADLVEKRRSSYRGLAFVGRKPDVDRLDGALSLHPSGLVLVTAPAGYGKTALLANWLTERQGDGCFVAYHFFFRDPNQQTRLIHEAYRNLLRQIRLYHGRDDHELPEGQEALASALHSIVKREGAPHEPLVILIDGLDEASDFLPYVFPQPLPKGVHVVASARAEDEEEPGYLAGWTQADPLSRICLHRLPRAALADWLCRHAELAALADDERFLLKFDEKTRGFPLDVEHRLQDLVKAAREGADVRRRLEETPAGFADYLESELRSIPEELEPLLAVLAAARGALRERDLKALVPGLDFRRLRLDVAADTDPERRRVAWQIARWLSISGRGESAWYAINEPLIAETFIELLGERADEARSALLEWCSQWREHQSEYVLRHYADHLLDAVGDHPEGAVPNEALRNREVLYDLVRDHPALAPEAADPLRSEPQLPLRMIEAAVHAAARTDHAAGMAEFVLKYLDYLSTLSRGQSPLEAIDRVSAKRALELSDLFEIERGVLWYLLVAWALADAGQPIEASMAVDRLLERELPLLSEWQEDAAAFLLTRVGAPDHSRLALVGRILGDRGSTLFCRHILQSTDASAMAVAETAARGIEDPEERRLVNAEIARAHARRGEPDIARATLRESDGAGADDSLLALFAEVQAASGEIEAACSTALSIERPENGARAWVGIGREQARAGDVEQATASFETARKLAQGLGQAGQWEQALSSVADVWTVRGGNDASPSPKLPASSSVRGYRNWIADAVGHAASSEEADATLAQAAAAWEEIEDPAERATLLGSLAPALAQLGASEGGEEVLRGARKAADGIADRSERIAILLALGRLGFEARMREAGAEGFLRAAKVAGQIPDARERLVELTRVAGAQNAVGLVDAASDAFAAAERVLVDIHDPSDRIRSLVALASAEAELGRLDRSIERFAACLEEAASILDEPERIALLYAVATAQVAAGQAEQAGTVFAEARELAGSLDDPAQRVAYLCVIALSQAEAGLTDEASRTFDCGRRAAKSIAKAQDRGACLAAISQGEATLERFDDARRTADAIEDAEYRTLALVALASRAARAGLRDRAAASFEAARMETAQIVDPIDRATAVVAVAEAWTRAEEAGRGPVHRALEETERALQLRRTRPAVDRPASGDPAERAAWLAASALLQAQGGDGEADSFAAAREAARALDAEGNRGGFVAVVELLAAKSSGHLRGVVRAFEKVATTVEDPVERATVLVELATEFDADSEGALADRASVAVRAVDDPGERARAFARLARWQARAGHADEAGRSFESAREAALSLREDAARIAALIAVAFLEAHARRVEGAEATLAAAGRAADSLSERDERAVLQEAVKRAKSQMTPSPTTDLDEQDLPLQRVMLLSAIAHAQAEISDHGAARETLRLATEGANSFEEGGDRARALAAVAQAHLHSEGREAAAPHFQAAEEALDTAMDPLVAAQASLELGRAYADSGDREGARAIFGRAREKVTAVRKRSQSTHVFRLAVKTLLGVAAAESEIGDARSARAAFAEALVASSANSAELAAWSLAAIAGVQREAGEFDAARETAALLVDEKTHKATLSDIAEAEAGVARPAEIRPLTDSGGLAVEALRDPSAVSAGLQEMMAAARALREEPKRAAAYAEIARQQALIDPDEAIRTAERILVDRSRHLVAIAGDLARMGVAARGHFEQLLVPCARYPESAYGVCSLLARVYPKQAGEVAPVVRMSARATRM
jgi:AAA ATPase domain